MKTLKNIIFNFTNNIFPNFEISKSYYINKNINSDDIVKKILTQAFDSPKEKIEKFDYSKYLNNFDIQTFKQCIFEKYIFNGLNSYLETLLQTYTRKILMKIFENENNIKNDLTIFNNILLEEVNSIVFFLSNIPKQQSYLLSSSNLIFEFQEANQVFTDNIIIKTTITDPVSLLEVKFDNFDYSEFKNYKNNLEIIFSLIFGTNVKFEIFDDIFSLYFKNYGCKEFDIDYMRDYFLSRKHRGNLFGTKYKINKANISSIKDLYLICVRLLTNLDKNNYIKIAIDFYKDSIKDDKFGASKITYLIIALEALFNTDRNEISRTIRQRCTKLLQNFYNKDQVKQIEKDLKTAYSIRCCYAHGSRHTNPKAEFELVNRILEYTKTAIILCLQLNKIYNKSDINKLLDDSLLYEDKNLKLCEGLKKLKIYFVTDDEKTDIPIFDLKR